VVAGYGGKLGNYVINENKSYSILKFQDFLEFSEHPECMHQGGLPVNIFTITSYAGNSAPQHQQGSCERPAWIFSDEVLPWFRPLMRYYDKRLVLNGFLTGRSVDTNSISIYTNLGWPVFKHTTNKRSNFSFEHNTTAIVIDLKSTT
jgi:hypothetical protein